MKEKQNHNAIFEELRDKYGSHSAAAKALGYRQITSYRQARRTGKLPPWRLDKAMQLLGDQPKEAA